MLGRKPCESREVGLSRRKTAQGGSKRNTDGCCHRFSCRAESAAWQAEGIREMRRALSDAIRYRDSAAPLGYRSYSSGRTGRRGGKNNQSAGATSAPQDRRYRAARVAARRASAPRAPAVVRDVAPPSAALAADPPLAPQKETVPVAAVGPPVFRATKPAGSFVAPRWARGSCPGCPDC